jgi:minor curlin subunit
MYAIRYHSGALKRLNSKQAFSAFTLGWLVMAFSVSVSAEENDVNSPQVDRQTAQMVITENELQLDAQEQAFAQSRANVALIRQMGDRNSTVINQNRNSRGMANLASIHQNGNFNDATINQEGSNNIGLVQQIGNRLEASITQNGNQYEAQVNQYGLEGKVNVSQSGSGYRTLTVEQLSSSGAGATAAIVTH